MSACTTFPAGKFILCLRVKSFNFRWKPTLKLWCLSQYVSDSRVSDDIRCYFPFGVFDSRFSDKNQMILDSKGLSSMNPTIGDDNRIYALDRPTIKLSRTETFSSVTPQDNEFFSWNYSKIWIFCFQLMRFPWKYWTFFGIAISDFFY